MGLDGLQMSQYAGAMPLEFDWDLHQPLSAAVGGLGFTDVPVMIAPGVWADGNQTVNLESVGAVAGGLVQWPLEGLSSVGSGPDSAEAIDTPFGRIPHRMAEGMRNYDWSIRWQAIPPGAAIVWSVGSDRSDDRGLVRLAVYDRSRETGDLLRIVPAVRRR